MTNVGVDVYEALRSAEIPEAKALNVCAALFRRHDLSRDDRSKHDIGMAELKSKLAVILKMAAAVLARQIAILSALVVDH